jgi:hypothetical protein
MQNNNDIRIRAVVFAEHEKDPNITVENLTEIIKPLVEYDVEELKDRATKNQIRRILGSVKGEDGVRQYFSKGNGRYSNIETTTSMSDLNSVEAQLYPKIIGTTKSYKKVQRRKQALLDQYTLFDMLDDTTAPN